MTTPRSHSGWREVVTWLSESVSSPWKPILCGERALPRACHLMKDFEIVLGADLAEAAFDGRRVSFVVRR